MRASQVAATAVGLSFLLATAGASFAATSSQSDMTNKGPAMGTTSGPAAGDNVSTGDQSADSDQAKKSEQQSGGAGVAGKPGGTNGPAQQPNSDKD
ncbi:MAG TPA: hypothetical protein VGG12_01655 [Methylovirgula sp.]|jgi:hypothetical protein